MGRLRLGFEFGLNPLKKCMHKYKIIIYKMSLGELKERVMICG